MKRKRETLPNITYIPEKLTRKDQEGLLDATYTDATTLHSARRATYMNIAHGKTIVTL